MSPWAKELRDPRWGMDATRANIRRNVADLVRAIDAWQAGGETYVLGLPILNVSRSLSADLSHLAHLEGRERLDPHWRETAS